ncbi:unnamed protein product, partial [Mesorhabditis belari]|uniref:Serpentine receptor class gamma n=1 Tax=Mesorhabditis belari TaxID=2138241 RepID=A0AAF3F5S2_9BILA
PLLLSSPSGRTILQIFLQLFRYGHSLLCLVMSANRLTSVLYPFKHKKIWEENNGRNLKLAIGLILSLDFLSQCHSITFIFLWGWKDASLGYPQIPGFDAWHRLYYAVTVSTVALICLVMNLLTIWEMRGLTERKYQWSLFGISILSTLMQIPAALFFTALSYAAFTGNQLSVVSLIASFSTFLNSSESWTNAQQDCSRIGGNLLSIHNAFQNGLLAQLALNSTGNSKTWLGAQNTTGTFVWTDGTPFDYQRFAKSVDSGDCVYLDSIDQLWKMSLCSQNMNFLCDVRVNPTTTSPSCLPELYHCQQGWQYFPRTGYSYMIVEDLNYDDAKSFCVSNGGQLASIHSDEENDFVTNLCSCTDGCVHDHQDHSFAVYNIGAQKINGNWTWLDGTPYDYLHDTCQNGVQDADIIVISNFDGCSPCGQ